MSVSPQPPMNSPTLPSPNGIINNHSNAQLANLLHQSYCDNDRLTKELNNTKKRSEKAERLLSEFQAATVNGAPLTAEARRVIEDAEARVAHADRQRDEAEARRRVVLESYEELNKYLAAIESRAADARAGFQRILRDAGGHLVLTPIPNQIQQEPIHTPYSANPSITVEPPPRPYHRSHRYTSSLSSTALPPGPLPPPPSTRGVRPRSGSFDDPSYLIAQVQPPSKRPRNDRGEYDHRPPLSAISMSRGRVSDLDPHPQQLPHIQHPQHPNHHLTIHPTHKSHSRSSSRSSVRATSQDIEDLLLDAATDERSALNSQVSPVGPLDQPGELRTYQTHIFAPPVTGAPQKKGKPGSSANIAHNGSPLTPPNAIVPTIAPVPPPAIPPTTSFPPTNAVGQRICRQCGLPGRYKDSKCVEKWGPGPEGPGTVCDRCRKKMKRVERRGTTDANVGGSGSSASAARLHRTDTIPVGPIGGTQRQTQTQSQIFTGSASFMAPSAPLQDKKRGGGSAKDRERERDRNREPPSPPAIATLQTTDDEDPGRRRRGAVSSAQHLPSPHSDPNPDTDPDADGEGDADVDAELREAADAAADHRSSSSNGMKEEDIEVGE
ncbi:uncharacterized protein EDB91DRAFT_1348880 [Suillus paluster]|uniref:uncharacterized protein n=1 Tax=Suillus paluster TaxID=48578 RepID=UPI001B85F679|nr:uncharacterized protein EDB91DRAFT_1348880 [Suillus paluster]KAG1733247.1 hypothetical protein EDB91DRAFT_1348880 [Suillus paluster]